MIFRTKFIPFKLMCFLAIHASPVHAESSSWDLSPYNWKNSPYNFENSPNNFKNSPKNYLNKKGSRGRLNIIGTFGTVIGYAVVKEDGGINYFDNDGKRIGYSPDKGKAQVNLEGKKEAFTIELED